MIGPSPARLVNHAPVTAPVVVQEEWGLSSAIRTIRLL